MGPKGFPPKFVRSQPPREDLPRIRSADSVRQLVLAGSKRGKATVSLRRLESPALMVPEPPVLLAPPESLDHRASELAAMNLDVFESNHLALEKKKQPAQERQPLSLAPDVEFLQLQPFHQMKPSDRHRCFSYRVWKQRSQLASVDKNVQHPQPLLAADSMQKLPERTTEPAHTVPALP